MPSTRDIRRRIRSVKNTAQITKAMQMVASSKMRRAQQAALAGRPYTTLMNEVLAEVSHHAGDFSHPLMEVREPRETSDGSRVALLVISTDKGLCGALNSNIMRETAKSDKAATIYVTAGRKAAQFIARTRRKLAAEFTYRDTPLFSEARAISRFVQDMFLKGEVDRVDVLFTNFISTLTQKAEIRTLLPIREIRGLTSEVKGEDATEALMKGSTEFLFEPTPGQVFGALLPHYLNFQVYQILLEAKASEHSARMVAMKNATDNAQQLIKDLTLEYNKLRQANITKELLEISSAAMSLG
jgi:F-type H+-transporting ATPase subunit gamma